MIEYLRAEYLSIGGSLVRVFKSGERYVTRKDVKDLHPFVKDDLADFSAKHPDVLEAYKRLKGAQGALKQNDIEESFDEQLFAKALSTTIDGIKEGGQAAHQYHTFAMGLCTFAFYPHLIYPIKEYEIHEGRKRIDIKYTNSSEVGFFNRLLQIPQTRALNVFIECKNYQKQLDNPELDQMSGRFGHQRGFFGIVFCRRMDDRDRIIKRCRDTAHDGRGYIIVLEDRDLKALLKLIEKGERSAIDSFMQNRFDELT